MTTTYTVTLSDRKNRRTIAAASPADAVSVAVGERCISTRLDSWTDHGTSTYSVAVATGPRRAGSTPFTNITATVTKGAK